MMWTREVVLGKIKETLDEAGTQVSQGTIDAIANSITVTSGGLFLTDANGETQQTSIPEAIADFISLHPYCVTEKTLVEPIDSRPPQRGQSDSDRIWTREELAQLSRDPSAFEKVRAEIEDARAEGRIVK